MAKRTDRYNGETAPESYEDDLAESSRVAIRTSVKLNWLVLDHRDRVCASFNHYFGEEAFGTI